MHARKSFFYLGWPILVLAVSATLALAGPSPPTNQLFGFISVNTTLTVSSPGPIYDVLGDLVVQPGVTLTIEPGVTLRFTANSDILGGGDFPALGELNILGHLAADASAGDSIRFLSSTGGSAEWGQIVVGGGGTATFLRCAIRGAIVGILNRGQTTLGDCSLSGGTGGIEIGVKGEAGALSVVNCEIVGFRNGIILSGGMGIVQECTLVGASTSSGDGLDYVSTYSTQPADSLDPKPTRISRFGRGVFLRSSNTSARNLVVFDNNEGIRGGGNVNYCTVFSNSSFGTAVTGFALTVLNSIAARNGGTGIGASFINFTDSWMNSGDDFSGPRGAQTASFNPFFLDETTRDLRLASNSIFKNYSNSLGEIGAYGPGPGGTVDVQRQTMTWGRIKADRR